MKKTLVNLKNNSVQLKMDMPIQAFQYFTSIIQNNILQEWIERKNVDKIKEIIEQFISDSTKSNYIIIISISPAFNLSHKKNCFLSIKIENITIFIYQAKPNEFPRFSQIKYNNPQTKTDSVQLISSKNLNDQDYINLEKIRLCSAEILEKGLQDWETELVVQMKNRLNLFFQPGFWHVFCSKKISVIVQQQPRERYLEYSIQKDGQTHKVIAFQKRGPAFNIREKIKLKIREIISFLVLLTFFVLLVGCKETSSESPSIWYTTGMKEQICSHRSQLLGMCAIILFGLLAQRMMKKYIEKGNKKKSQ